MLLSRFTDLDGFRQHGLRWDDIPLHDASRDYVLLAEQAIYLSVYTSIYLSI